MFLRTLFIFLFVILALAPRAFADPKPLLDALTQNNPDRSAGSDAAQKNADQLAAELTRLTNRPTLRQPFLLTVPVVDKCLALDPMLQQIPIAPLLPSGLQPAAVAPLTAPLLYVGAGSLEELKGLPIAHSIVALDLASPPTAWQRIASLGPAAILFLADNNPNTDFLNKSTTIPLGTPRLYCDDPQTTVRIRARQISFLTLSVHITWQERTGDNLLCLIPGRQLTPNLPIHDKNWINQLLILQTRYDAPSQVLTRAPGATQALNTAILLDLAQQIANAPDHCTVLILLTAGDQWNLRGTRAFLDLLNRQQKTSAAAIADLQHDVADTEYRLAATAKIFDGLTRISSADFSPLTDEPVRTSVEDQMLRTASSLETKLEAARLGTDALLVADLEAQKHALISAIAALDAHTARTDEQKNSIQSAAAAVLPRWQTELTRLTNQQKALLPWPALRHDLGETQPALFLSLAITPGSPSLGLFSRSHYAAIIDSTGPMAGFSQPFRRYAAQNPNLPFDLHSLENSFTLESFFPLKLAFSSDACLARGLPAAAFATTSDPAPFLDTPSDTADKFLFNWQNISAQEQTLSSLLIGAPTTPGALTDPNFYARAELTNITADQDLTLFERTLGETLPRLRAAETPIAVECLLNDQPLGPPLAGTLRLDINLTHVDGTTTFSSEFRIPDTMTRLQALTFNAVGTPTRSLVASQSDVNNLSAEFYPDSSHPIRSMLFDSVRLDCYNLFDPRYLDTLDQIDILDARRLGNPADSAVFTDANSGTAAVFFPPDIRWQLLVAKGNLANRMILINADAEHPTGQGFDTTDLAKIGPFPYRTALDLDAINTKRKNDLERFGISSEIIKQLHAAAQPQIQAARAADADHDYPALFRTSNAAWSLESQVYHTLIATSDGIIHGVVFLLLGIIPFSFFLERLLIGSTSVYKQIGWFAAIFAAMTALLWGHPAFRISPAPLMILLAFLILILSCTVVYILYGKFEEEIAILRGASTVHSTSLRRATVLGAAIRLGLSNMRRRPTRTFMTLITLVLLTFTLLCFTSVQESLQTSPRLLADTPNKTAGVFLHDRTWRTLPDDALSFARHLETDEPSQIAPRYWYSSEKSEQPWLIPIRNYSPEQTLPDPPTFYAAALLGLSKNEPAFQPKDSLNLRSLADSNFCLLPTNAQSILNIHLGDTITILGHRLPVTGFYADASTTRFRNINGDPMTPTDPSSNTPQNQQNSNAPVTRQPTYRYLSPDNVVIVPAALVQQLGGRLTSIMLPPLAAPLTPEALSERSAFTLYTSDGSHVLAVNSTESSRPQDLSAVLVPMALAAVIILNTMLGAVSERTREIHVYTSVGLAPSHVGMLFLAEAAALGTLGVVFGYIVGQGLATLLSHTSLLPGVDLNYSSTSAITTMAIVLGIVMLSALWPARAASRIAAPSLQRDWKLPKPVGDLLSVDLPFTVNESAAKGILAFLEEFFLTAAQTGNAHFTADNLAPILENPSGLPNRHIRGLSARIWLAPYDLGVIQTLRLTIHPTDQPHVFDVHLALTREAGNPSTWHRLNRPFLTEIRKQFLLWRNLDHAQVAGYITRSEELFASTNPNPHP